MNSLPSDLIAALWLLTETAVQLLDPICTGDDLPTVVPSPNCPSIPRPQVNSLPSDLMAAVWPRPAETAVQLLDPICTGDDEFAGLPPTCTGDDSL